jgi:hypothetical protein
MPHLWIRLCFNDWNDGETPEMQAETQSSTDQFVNERRCLMTLGQSIGSAMSILIKVIGSVVAGWFFGAALGLGISHTVYDGKADQLPIVLIPIITTIIFIVSFFLPKPRY